MYSGFGSETDILIILRGVSSMWLHLVFVSHIPRSAGMSAACFVGFDRFESLLKFLSWVECTEVKENCKWTHGPIVFPSSLLLLSSPRPPVASLCPSTVTPLASGAAFLCNDIPPSQTEERTDRRDSESPGITDREAER